MCEVIFVLSVMCVVGGVPLWVECVFRRVDVVCFVSVVHPVTILSAVFCDICSLVMFMSDASGDHMVGTYLSMGLVMALYVAMIVSFCFPHVVDVSDLSLCIVLRAFVVVISMFVVCEFGGRESVLVFFWIDVHAECNVVYL